MEFHDIAAAVPTTDRAAPRRTTGRRRKALVRLAAAGLFAAGPGGANAADDPAMEALRGELARVQAENARLKQALGQRDDVQQTPAPEAAPAPAAASSAAAPSTAASVPGLAVSVHGRNRLAALQDTPTSASVVSGDELQRLNATSVRDITKRVANVTRQNSSNARSADLAIRGIGRKGNSEAQDPNVGITVDGVSYGYAGLSAWDFVDIDSVEVLRGPVGTLGGKNANVGGLYINTKKPSFTPGADVSITVGQRDGLIASAAITGPVIDDLLAWRGTFYVDKVRGAYTNAYDAGDSTYTDRNKLSGKLQLLFKPSEDFSALLSVNKQPRTGENDNGLNLFHAPPPTYSDGTPVNLSTDAGHRLGRDWFGQLRSYDYKNNYLNYNSGVQDDEEQRPLVTGVQGLSLDLNWDLGGSRLRAITAFDNFYFDARNDEGTPFDISTQGGGGIRYKQWSQELRLTSRNGGPFEYQAGLYAIGVHHNVDSKTGFGHDAGAWFASDAQYAALAKDGNGRYLMANSLDYLRKLGVADNRSFSPAVYGQFDWHLSDAATLTAGARLTHEHRTASGFTALVDEGVAPELDDTAFLTDANGALKAGNTTAQLQAADAAAHKYFGVAQYASLGAAQQKQVAAAKAIRKANVGLLYDKVPADTVNETQKNFNLSPSVKFDERFTGYFSYQHGEKAGVAQVVNGVSLDAAPERADNLELGLKSALFDRTLVVAADVFLSNFRNYQQQAYVLDTYGTALAQASDPNAAPVYIAATGNAARVRAKGFEVDATYTGLPRTTLRLSGAYDDVRYRSFRNAAQPPEANPAGPKYRDLRGRLLPGAARYSGNVGVEHRIPTSLGGELHLDANYAYTSSYNSDVTLSQYGWIKGYGITDLAIGAARLDRSWDVSLILKNAFDVRAKAPGFTSGTLDTTPRWAAVQVTARL